MLCPRCKQRSQQVLVPENFLSSIRKYFNWPEGTTWDQIIEIIENKAPKTVVITGGFQYLHDGHIIILQRCKLLGKVIVLLNSDDSILRTKGYLGESWTERKENLLATELVDEVIEIEESPAEKIQELMPDYWVAGSDHTKEEMILNGGNFAKELKIFPRTEGISSSKIHSGMRGEEK